MSLFQIDDIKKENKPSEKKFADAIRFNTKSKVVMGKAAQSLEDTIGKISAGENILFVSGGRWSAHDLRLYLLGQSGPAKVNMSTWAISEEAARVLVGCIDQGMITELNCIFDRRIRVRKPKVLQLAKQMATKITLVDCHAKCFTIENDTWKISVLTTANDTNNKRIELGVIFTDPVLFHFMLSWIIPVINNGDPFNWKRNG